VLATPVGLVIAAGFATASATPLAGPRAGQVLRHRSALRTALVGATVGWAVLSLARVPPLSGPPPTEEAVGLFDLLAAGAVVLFAFAAWRSAQLFRTRGGTLALALAVACVLLGEAMVAVTVSRNWHLSWW
jgi:hypothetical protein